METECPFCGCPERILKENELAFVLLSNPLKTETHLLVIPKRHVEKPWELSSEESSAVLELVNELQPKIVERYGGCDLRQNCRPFMPQSRLKVNHVHYHLIPRSSNDNLYNQVEKYETIVFREATNIDKQIAQEIISN